MKNFISKPSPLIPSPSKKGEPAARPTRQPTGMLRPANPMAGRRTVDRSSRRYLGGEPKCCKSFLALDVAVSVASGTACLRHIPLQLSESGPVVVLKVMDHPLVEPETPLTPTERVRQALAQVQEPIPVQQLQKLCGTRTATVLLRFGRSDHPWRSHPGRQRLPTQNSRCPFPPYRPSRKRKRERLRFCPVKQKQALQGATCWRITG